MEKSGKDGLKVLGFIVIVAFLAILFTVDDVTGVGQLLDPLEFALMSLVGLGYPHAAKAFSGSGGR